MAGAAANSVDLTPRLEKWFHSDHAKTQPRRLHTVMTTLLEDVLFNLPEVDDKKFVFDAPQVRERLVKIVEDEDLRKYIL